MLHQCGNSAASYHTLSRRPGWCGIVFTHHAVARHRRSEAWAEEGVFEMPGPDILGQIRQHPLLYGQQIQIVPLCVQLPNIELVQSCN